MPRASNKINRHERRKKILKQAKGYWGRRSKNFKAAKEAVANALQYAYRDRKNKKRNFRALWIARISARCRENGVTYSRFMQGLKASNIKLNRKILSNMAIEDPTSFDELINKTKEVGHAKN